MDKIAITLWITFGIYILVLLAILADLWSGVRKAKRLGISRTSYGFKRTVDKVAKYYNMLLALTIVDAMQMGAFWYLDKFYEIVWPMFPFITLLGGLGTCLIEIKSIYEKAEDKVRLDDVSMLVGKIVTNKDDIPEIVKSVLEYMNSPQNKNKSATFSVETESGIEAKNKRNEAKTKA